MSEQDDTIWLMIAINYAASKISESIDNVGKKQEPKIPLTPQEQQTQGLLIWIAVLAVWIGFLLLLGYR